MQVWEPHNSSGGFMSDNRKVGPYFKKREKVKESQACCPFLFHTFSEHGFDPLQVKNLSLPRLPKSVFLLITAPATVFLLISFLMVFIILSSGRGIL